MPGVLPVLNRAAVRCAIKFGLATNAEIGRRSVFARKNYFYPDLPKGYQISQLDHPIVGQGEVSVALDNGERKTVRLTRAHLEEDAGKSLHEDFQGMSGIDLNVSIRPAGDEALGTRTEIKNVNSFRFLERAINFEVQRQAEILEDGGRVVQETRLYDADLDETRSMRSKEEANDYRYFPDPDLLPVVVEQADIDAVARELPELPEPRRARFVASMGLGDSEASLLVLDRDLADYFESALESAGPDSAKTVANWSLNELRARLEKSPARSKPWWMR